mmetsp:Transcript_10421/g.22061  ORF Transcript_10421/g.22061 Transcript_10421/m.22061 type:complete len:433 (-) Transcript_10421:171-1469(-)
MDSHRLPFTVIFFAYTSWALATRVTTSDDELSLLMAATGTSSSKTRFSTRRQRRDGVASFEEFVKVHGRNYQPGTEDYKARQALFEERLAWVESHNSQPGRLWTAAVNKLADQTNEELAQLRGYNRFARPQGHGVGRAPAQLINTGAQELRLSDLPAEFTWKGKLGATSEIEDQSSCGSCWAFAAATVLRAHSELYQKDRKFSVQQIVSCTPNPQECGGQGGCAGATAELAMDYVVKKGCDTEDNWPYTASDGNCDEAGAILLESKKASEMGGASFGMMGFQKLAENDLAPLMVALYDQGPVSISIAAGAAWNHYYGGVFDSCGKDVIIDHAVMLVGYGEDEELNVKFWQIQNSWGPSWGENGGMRMLRRSNTEEAAYCGTDDSPEIGSGCKGGPSQVTVCGTCGILYDTVVPTFKLANGSYWARQGRTPDP